MRKSAAALFVVTALVASAVSVGTASVAEAAGDPCVVPGVEVLTDPANDQNPAFSTQVDIRSVSIAGAFRGTPEKLVFTMKVGSLSGAIAVNTSWRILWTSPDAKVYFVSMETFIDPVTNPTGVPQYKWGTVAGSLATTQGDADAGTFTPDGTITITIATSKVGNPAPGQDLTAINARTQLLVGAAGTGGLVTIDSTTTPGTYKLSSCAPTVVAVRTFSAARGDGSVVLRWRTASENGLIGFNVWRRGSGRETKVNRALIVATGGSRGASYTLVDRSARAATAYTYRLQVVNLDGSRSWHASARVRAGR